MQTIKAVQAIAGSSGHGFVNWFEALDWMCGEVKKHDFDIALIGAGAFGLPLASYVKQLGKQAVHVGGALQLLFGIRGSRWEEDPGYRLNELLNQHWVRPLPEERPSGAERVENACYW